MPNIHWTSWSPTVLIPSFVSWNGASVSRAGNNDHQLLQVNPWIMVSMVPTIPILCIQHPIPGSNLSHCPGLNHSHSPGPSPSTSHRPTPSHCPSPKPIHWSSRNHYPILCPSPSNCPSPNPSPNRYPGLCLNSSHCPNFMHCPGHNPR